MFSWSSMTGVPSHQPPRPVPGLRVGQISLRRGRVEAVWWLAPGADPQTVRDVSLAAGDATYPADVVPDESAPDLLGRTHGVFCCALPESPFPLAFMGMGPEGAWRQEVDLDPLVLDDYRRSVPVHTSAEHDGVTLTVERVAACAERLAVFYAVAVDETEVSEPSAVGMQSLHRDGTRYHVHAPPAATWPPRPVVHALVAYFPAQPGSSEVAFEIAGVALRCRVELSVRLPVPQSLPAVTDPDIELPTGHRIAEAVFTARGVLLRFVAGPGAGILQAHEVATADGRRLPMRGGWGGDDESGMVTGPMPSGTTALVLSAVQVHDRRTGIWRVSFAVPGEA